MVALYRRNGELPDQRPSSTATATRPDLAEPATPGLTIQEVVEQRLVTAEFQSIHRLDTTEPVGFEAFARGPAGELNNPGKLFGAAASAGLSVELDQVAHAAAYRAALMGKLNPSQPQPRTARTAPPHRGGGRAVRGLDQAQGSSAHRPRRRLCQ